MVGTLRAALLTMTLALAVMLALLTILSSGAGAQHAGDRAPKVAEVQILGFNDFHGWLQSPSSSTADPKLGGAAYLAAYLDRYEERNPNGTIRIHDGDLVGGSPLISSYSHDEPAIYAANMMDLDVGTLGNHEFDEGGREMLRLIRGGQRTDGNQFKDGPDGEPVNTSDPDFPGANFPYVSANTVYAKNNKTVVPPYVVVKRKNERIAFIGINTPETKEIVAPDAVAPFRFLDISKTVNRYTKQLRARGIESIVVLAHSGGLQDTTTGEVTGEIATETAQMSSEVDVVVSGHSHTKINQEINGKLVVQALSFGRAFEAINLRINRRSDDVVNATAEIVDVVQSGITPDRQVQRLVAGYQAEITPVESRVVGVAGENVSRTANAAGESALGDLIADAQRAYAPNNGESADFAFMNPGGIRADIAAGDVTYGELFAVQPFDNQLVRMDLTGAQIKELLEQQFQTDDSGNPRTRILQVSGLRFSYHSTNAAGERITSVTDTKGTPETSDDTPIDEAATYSVAANSFIATGGDGFTVFEQGQNQRTLGGDLDALEAYIDSLPQPFDAPDPATEQRITRQG
jgi:5'-nucleotidase